MTDRSPLHFRRRTFLIFGAALLGSSAVPAFAFGQAAPAAAPAAPAATPAAAPAAPSSPAALRRPRRSSVRYPQPADEGQGKDRLRRRRHQAAGLHRQARLRRVPAYPVPPRSCALAGCRQPVPGARAFPHGLAVQGAGAPVRGRQRRRDADELHHRRLQLLQSGHRPARRVDAPLPGIEPASG